MQVNAVYEGDCLDVMKELPDNCIDTILTDPPYSLNFMNKDWDDEIAFNPEVWREALRVAKPGATLMAFGGSRTSHRLACAIEDAGWEIRDCVTYLNDGSQAEATLMASLNDEQLAAYLELHYPNGQCHWVYGSGMGLGYDVSKGIDKSKGAEREVLGQYARPDGSNPRNNCQTPKFNGKYNNGNPGLDANDQYITAPATPLAAKFSGYRSRLKPAFEPIIYAQKPIDTNYATNAEKWGVSGLNIDGARVQTNGESLQRPERNGIGNVGGWHNYTQPKGLYGTPKGLGRYPANIISDGSEQVEAEFAKAGMSVSSGRLIKPGTRTALGQGSDWNAHNNKDRVFQGLGDTGTPSRYFATCPPNLPRFIYQAKASPAERGAANNHPTVKPLSLIRELAKLTKPPDGGVVLDPFAGSGTTALAAIAENRDYILIEKEPEYCEIIKRRIAEYTGQEVATKEIEVKGETVKQMPLW